MCSRYSLTRRPQWSEPDVEISESAEMESFAPHYNIAPSQRILTLRQRASTGKREAGRMRWGLIPYWAKDPGMAQHLINARSESVLEKPAFREAFAKRRCLIPADGFFEWKKEGKLRRPFRYTMKDDSIFYFGGVWERWRAPDGTPVFSCSILTTEPNELVRPIHNRMPVIVPQKDQPVWLDATLVKPSEVQEVCAPLPAEEMKCYEVSRVVNNPNNDGPECIAPIAAPTDLFSAVQEQAPHG